MKKIVYVSVRKVPFVTFQDVIHVIVLIAIALLFCLIPARSFGQALPGNIANEAFPVSDFDSALSLTTAAPEPAAATIPSITPEIPAASPLDQAVEPYYAPAKPALPEPAAATASPMTASQYPSVQVPAYQQTQQRLPQRHEVAAINIEHPFRQYWGVPKEPQTKIAGKPMTVAELLAGTRSSSVRCQLLQAYWELSGLLAIYHFRCEIETLATGMAGAQQENMLTLLREQRRTAELEFIKQQWVLAGLLKQSKGRTLRESELPIPSDFPLYPRYQTFADKIARSERTQYLGRMIPIQEQLIESKNGTWKAASEMAPSATQPFFVISTHRTTAFVELTKAITEYNKMIAEYALETIPSNVSPQQLVAAVVRLPHGNSSPKITQTQYEVPEEVMAQPVEQVGYEWTTPVQTQDFSQF